MPTGARIVTGYSEISEKVLERKSIIREVSNKDVQGSIAQGTQIKVYVNTLTTIADYVPGTGVSQSSDGSDYVTLNNLKEKGINEILDGFTVENAPEDMVRNRFGAAMETAARQIDLDGFVKMEDDGTEASGTFGTDDVTASNLVVGKRYKVEVANSAGDATDVGLSTATAIVGEEFTALTDGTGLTALVVNAVIKPTEDTIYSDVLNLVKVLDENDAPEFGRSLIVTPEMRNLLLNPDSKVFLAGGRADNIQTTAFIGRFLDFNVFVTNNLPSGVNMIALQERGFAHTDEFIKPVSVVSLDGSTNFYGDSAIKGRWGYNSGAIRPELIQINKGA